MYICIVVYCVCQMSNTKYNSLHDVVAVRPPTVEKIERRIMKLFWLFTCQKTLLAACLLQTDDKIMTSHTYET